MRVRVELRETQYGGQGVNFEENEELTLLTFKDVAEIFEAFHLLAEKFKK
jgi:hypothetical protein